MTVKSGEQLTVITNSTRGQSCKVLTVGSGCAAPTLLSTSPCENQTVLREQLVVRGIYS